MTDKDKSLDFKNQDLIKRIIKFLRGIKERYPSVNVDRNGEVSYCNGNDGTEFDWNVNGRLCEFGYGVPDGSVWAFKCLIYKDGTAECYCYPNGEMTPVEVITEKLFSNEEMIQLYDSLLTTFDYNGVFDATLEGEFHIRIIDERD